MKIEKHPPVTKYVIRGYQDESYGQLDVIAVYVEDVRDGAGKITITHSGESWSHSWSHMGKGVKLNAFFKEACVDYLVCKLKTGIKRKIEDLDPERMLEVLRVEIIRQRKEREITRDRARWLWDDAQWVDESNYSDTFSEVFADEWWEGLPRQHNPAYVELTHIVEAVKQGFALLEGE